MENTNYTIALLIDVENETHYIERLLKELKKRGTVPYRRAYGKTKINKATWEALENLGVKIVGHTSDKKNATDIRLCIDAMNILYEKRPNAICIVSGDGDYVPLINEIRERGVYCIVAARKEIASESLKNACDEVIHLTTSTKPTVPEKQVVKEAPAAPAEKILSKEEIAEQTARDEDVVAVAKRILKEANAPVNIGTLCTKIYADEKVKEKYPNFKFEKGQAKEFFLKSKLAVTKNEGGTCFVALLENKE